MEGSSSLSFNFPQLKDYSYQEYQANRDSTRWDINNTRWVPLRNNHESITSTSHQQINNHLYDGSRIILMSNETQFSPPPPGSQLTGFMSRPNQHPPPPPPSSSLPSSSSSSPLSSSSSQYSTALYYSSLYNFGSPYYHHPINNNINNINNNNNNNNNVIITPQPQLSSSQFSSSSMHYFYPLNPGNNKLNLPHSSQNSTELYNNNNKYQYSISPPHKPTSIATSSPPIHSSPQQQLPSNSNSNQNLVTKKSQKSPSPPTMAEELVQIASNPKSNKRCITLNKNILKMKQNDAARLLGIAPSTFSKRWRQSIPDRKWPYRHHIKLQRSLKEIKRKMVVTCVKGWKPSPATMENIKKRLENEKANNLRSAAMILYNEDITETIESAMSRCQSPPPKSESGDDDDDDDNDNDDDDDNDDDSEINSPDQKDQ